MPIHTTINGFAVTWSRTGSRYCVIVTHLESRRALVEESDRHSRLAHITCRMIELLRGSI